MYYVLTPHKTDSKQIFMPYDIFLITFLVLILFFVLIHKYYTFGLIQLRCNCDLIIHIMVYSLQCVRFYVCIVCLVLCVVVCSLISQMHLQKEKKSSVKQKAVRKRLINQFLIMLMIICKHVKLYSFLLFNYHFITSVSLLCFS